MNCVFELDNHKLYLGNINAANDPQYLRKHDVGAVLSVIDTSDIKIEKSVIHLVTLFSYHFSGLQLKIAKKYN